MIRTSGDSKPRPIMKSTATIHRTWCHKNALPLILIAHSWFPSNLKVDRELTRNTQNLYPEKSLGQILLVSLERSSTKMTFVNILSKICEAIFITEQQGIQMPKKWGCFLISQERRFKKMNSWSCNFSDCKWTIDVAPTVCNCAYTFLPPFLTKLAWESQTV